MEALQTMLERAGEESRVFRTVSVAKMVDEVERRVATQMENMEARLAIRFGQTIKRVVGNGESEGEETPITTIPEAEEMGQIIGTTIIKRAEERLSKQHSKDCNESNHHLTIILTQEHTHANTDLQTAKRARQGHEEQAQEAATKTHTAKGNRQAHESFLQELTRLPHPERYQHRHRIESHTLQVAHWKEEERNNEAWMREHETSVEEERGREQRARGKCAVLEVKLEELRATGLIDWERR